MPLDLLKVVELNLINIKAHEVAAATGIAAQYIFTTLNPLNGSIENSGIQPWCIVAYYDNTMIALALYRLKGIHQAFAKGVSHLLLRVELEEGRFHALKRFAGSFRERIVK